MAALQPGLGSGEWGNDKSGDWDKPLQRLRRFDSISVFQLDSQVLVMAKHSSHLPPSRSLVPRHPHAPAPETMDNATLQAQLEFTKLCRQDTARTRS